MDAVIGVDVGTGSARAGVFDGSGRMLGQASRSIQAWHPKPDYVQQSTADIWAAVCASVREALAQAGTVTVGGIGFDATCSLAVLDCRWRPGLGQPGRRAGAERHRLDGPPRGVRGGSHQCRRL
jgi:ribulose kinase